MFFDAFNYVNGNLTGQGGWTAGDGGTDSFVVSSSHLLGGPDQSENVSPTFVGSLVDFDATVEFSGIAATLLTGTLFLLVGDPNGTNAEASLDADNAWPTKLNPELVDPDGGTTTGPLLSGLLTGTHHTLTMRVRGQTATLLVDGIVALGGSVTGTGWGSLPGMVKLAFSGQGGSHITIYSVTVTTP